MDVEDVRAMLGPYYALVREQLEQRGGTIEKFIGDAVVAVFGAPAAHEDDPERAVRAALAIREALAGANERDPQLGLHVRIGVNTGEALVELDTDPAAGESFVSGDVVNTASRLQAAAPIDGVLARRATRSSTSRWRRCWQRARRRPCSAGAPRTRCRGWGRRAATTMRAGSSAASVSATRRSTPSSSPPRGTRCRR